MDSHPDVSGYPVHYCHSCENRNPVLINNLDTCFHGQSHHDNCRAMSCPRQTPTSSGNRTTTTAVRCHARGRPRHLRGIAPQQLPCNVMPEADPDIFGELHHDNCRAMNCTATLFVNLLLLCSGGIYATINIVPVNFILFYFTT